MIGDGVDTFKQMILWFIIGAASAPIWGSLLYVLWQGVVRPRLIPAKEIERLAAQMVERHGDRAADAVFANEYHAWRCSNGFEQAKWRRVRCQIERRCG